MIGIIDYGVGNLFSLRSSFASLGQDVIVSGDADVLAGADRLVLPGVGAFADAAQKLRDTGLDQFVIRQANAGKPLMGICLGMQMLFEKSFEYGEHQGIGILKGQVVPMAGVIDPKLKVPHMGWNQLKKLNPQSRLLSDISDGEYVYFVHSYFATGCEQSLVAVADYSIPLTAVVEQGNVFGCQFHPEKSGTVGLRILNRFCNL
jgi:glutamine amidotransferase